MTSSDERGGMLDPVVEISISLTQETAVINIRFREWELPDGCDDDSSGTTVLAEEILHIGDMTEPRLETADSLGGRTMLAETHFFFDR